MRLRHDVVMLRRAVREPGHEALREHSRSLGRAPGPAPRSLRDLAEALSEGQPPERSDAMAEAIGEYRSAIDEMRRARADQASAHGCGLAALRRRVRFGAVPPRPG